MLDFSVQFHYGHVCERKPFSLLFYLIITAYNFVSYSPTV